MPASDILRNNVKEKLARGEVVASMTVRLSRSIEIARIAKTAGFDMLYIDLEHSPLTMDATGQICMACLDIGIMPAVRVPANTPDYISRILDAGALGRDRAACALGRRGARGGAGREAAAARRTLEHRDISASAIPLVPGRGDREGDQRRHHGDRAVRIRRLPGQAPTRSSRSRASTSCWSA